MKIAIYPGSFDPITYGHLDVLNRALKIFDKVIVLVASNPQKKSRFTPQERLEMIKEATEDIAGVVVDVSEGLTVQYAKDHQASHLIRGLRAVTDFEYEFELASANEFVDSSIDSVFLMSRVQNSFINSSTVMELAKAGVDVSELVPPSVLKRLK
ncbi:MAG: pantetheine-phosphate adenylyltransferase [Bacilli bacterium]|jgi:pantetheine-phosphate adenylyltransferase|nr:pantetheine-phosphate adenylyltransferase [Bacilli bacterium]